MTVISQWSQPLLAFEDLPLTATSKIHFATAAQGQAILTTRDRFIEAMTPLDREIRRGQAEPVSIEQYLDYAGRQSLDWQPDEVDKLKQAAAFAAQRLGRWKLNFPEVVRLVKTTGKEEAGGGYCREATIVIPQRTLAADANHLRHLMLHELFHILSRHNPELRDQLYAVIGYRRVGAIELPEELARLRLTNPDAPLPEHVIDLKLGDRTVSAASLLYSSRKSYDERLGNSVLSYVNFVLVEVTKTEQGWRWQPNEQGRPNLMEANRMASFAQQVGRNTAYIIDPEEILAENFAMLAEGRQNLPNPEILQAMDKVLAAPPVAAGQE